MISSLVALARQPEYFNKVIPNDQSFEKTNYAGIFHFRIWQFGHWYEIIKTKYYNKFNFVKIQFREIFRYDVVVDDLLPVDEDDELIFCSNTKDSNEMWAPLLEKAFAKLNTCYEFLDDGEAVNGMTDLTGGIHESYLVKGEKEVDGMKFTEADKLWEKLFKSFCMKSLIGAGIDQDEKNREIKENQLVPCYFFIFNN